MVSKGLPGKTRSFSDGTVNNRDNHNAIKKLQIGMDQTKKKKPTPNPHRRIKSPQEWISARRCWDLQTTFISICSAERKKVWEQDYP